METIQEELKKKQLPNMQQNKFTQAIDKGKMGKSPMGQTLLPGFFQGECRVFSH